MWPGLTCSHIAHSLRSVYAGAHETPPPLCRWREAAAAYLEIGHTFVEECGRMGAMSRQSLSQVDRARAEFDAADILYTQALDGLEV